MKQLKRSECAILPLVLKGKWYDMIASGEKKEEYRDAKPYWAKRIVNVNNRAHTGCNKPIVIAFSRGYRKADMFIVCVDIVFHDWSSDASLYPYEIWGEPRRPHYAICLGERVELVD
jgi:hypothetical protein